MRAIRLLPSALLVAGLVLAGCGGDSDDGATGDPAGTTASTSAPATSAPVDGGTEPGTSAPDEEPAAACESDLVVAGSDADDGSVAVATAITDGGPHPANTVDSDATLEGAIATYELVADPQFGLGVPVGVPEVPADGLIYVFSLALDDPAGTIAVGDTFASTTGDPSGASGRIANHGLFSGTSGRINPLGDTTIEITEITDEQVCGTISAVGQTELQAFPTLTGTFTADRVQFLEAEG